MGIFLIATENRLRERSERAKQMDLLSRGTARREGTLMKQKAGWYFENKGMGLGDGVTVVWADMQVADVDRVFGR